MKKVVAIAVLILFAITSLSAQSYSPCYESAFAEGKRLYNAGQYQKAKNFFKEAKECPDSNKAAAKEWIGKCETQLRKQAEMQEKEAYDKCITVGACENYLKEYPKGKYVDVVTKKKWAYGHPILKIGNRMPGGISRKALQKIEGLVVERDGIGYEVIGYTLKPGNARWGIKGIKATSAAFTTRMRDAFESDCEFMICDIQVKDADGIVSVLPDSYGLYTYDVVVKNDSVEENSRKPIKIKKLLGLMIITQNQEFLSTMCVKGWCINQPYWPLIA